MRILCFADMISPDAPINKIEAIYEIMVYVMAAFVLVGLVCALARIVRSLHGMKAKYDAFHNIPIILLLFFGFILSGIVIGFFLIAWAICLAWKYFWEEYYYAREIELCDDESCSVAVKMKEELAARGNDEEWMKS